MVSDCFSSSSLDNFTSITFLSLIIKINCLKKRLETSIPKSNFRSPESQQVKISHVSKQPRKTVDTISPLYSMGVFFDAQGQLTLLSVVQSGQNSNTPKI